MNEKYNEEDYIIPKVKSESKREALLKQLLAEYGESATLADIVGHEKLISELRFKFPCNTMYTFDAQDISWKDEADKSNDTTWLTIPQAIEAYFKDLKICTERHDKDNNTYAKMTEMFSKSSIYQIAKMFTTGITINNTIVHPLEFERSIEEKEIIEYISNLYVAFKDEYYPFDYYISSRVKVIY